MDSGVGKKRGSGEVLFVDNLLITCLKVSKNPIDDELCKSTSSTEGVQWINDTVGFLQLSVVLFVIVGELFILEDIL